MIMIPHLSGAIFLMISLMLPMIIVTKWQARPVRAMLTALCFFTLPAFVGLAFRFSRGLPGASGTELLVAFILFMVIYLGIGVLILAFLQRRSRVKRERLRQHKMDFAALGQYSPL